MIVQEIKGSFKIQVNTGQAIRFSKLDKRLNIFTPSSRIAQDGFCHIGVKLLTTSRQLKRLVFLPMPMHYDFRWLRLKRIASLQHQAAARSDSRV